MSPFERLTVIGYTGAVQSNGQQKVTCQCSCDGSYVDIALSSLRSGATGSCGCLHRERAVASNTARKTHGHASGGKVTPEYRAWCAMLSRCLKPAHDAYIDYGGRGIKVCDHWIASFENFLQAVGRRPSRLFTLNRVDNEGNYEPGNVKWSTSSEQNRNTRTTLFYELNGERKSLGEWCEIYKLPYDLVLQRLDKFRWTLQAALTLPAGGGGPWIDTPSARGLYGRWYMMIDRCYNVDSVAYADYGGRGIKVADRWRNSFKAYCQDVGDLPSTSHTLGRPNNNDSYGPDNFAWETATQQARNRRNTKLYELYGELHTLAEWAEIACMPYPRVKQRVITYKWPLDEALGTPISGGGRMADADRKKWLPGL